MLQGLTNPSYHLVDAYPLLCKVYAIAVAIPVSSCTAELTFSVLKRVKSQFRITVLQERLDYYLDVKKRIVASPDKNCIIDAQLSKLLIE